MRNQNGAGFSRQYQDQQDPEGRGHWFKLRDQDIKNPDGKYCMLQKLWQDAIKNPGVMQEVIWTQGVGPGSKHREFAMYDPEKRMMLANESACPNRSGHHLYQTCWCCGQYG